MENIKIYVLIDPRDNQIRYVGKTVQLLKDRLKHHFYHTNSKSSRKTYRSWWILSLLKIGIKPIISLVEENIEKNKWQEREIFYIKYYKQLGCRLTNLTDGGQGGEGRIQTEETKRKISETNKGRKHTQEAKNKISATHKGKLKSQEHRTKIGKAHKGKLVSTETREKLRIVNTGKHLSDEAKKKVGDFHRGKPRSEEIKNKISQSHIGITPSEATKKKLSRLAKARWALKRKEQEPTTAAKHNTGPHNMDQSK